MTQLNMMSRCVIHIGMHKTGSTSIQHSLNGYHDDRFVYLSLRNANHSVELGRLFGFRKIPSDSFNSETIKLIEKSRLFSGDRTLILSAEDISAFNEAELKKMAIFLRTMFVEVTIIGYVRPPGAYIQSAFQEMSKSSKQIQKLKYRNYKKTFEKFDIEFGRENVHLFKFDRLRLKNQCVVTDFCFRLGIKLPQEKIVIKNESISLLTSQLLFCYHQYYDPRPCFSWLLDPVLSSFDNTMFRVSPQTRIKLIQDNLHDVSWMEQRLGIPLDEDLGDESPNDIFDGSQLLSPNQRGVSALRALVGHRVGCENKGESTRELAIMVNELINFLNKPESVPMDSWADHLRDMALKIESETPLVLNDALNLMRIASLIRPKGPLISRKVLEWEAQLGKVSGINTSATVKKVEIERSPK